MPWIQLYIPTNHPVDLNPTILYAIQAKRLSCTKRQDNLFFDLRNITGKDMISKTGTQIEFQRVTPTFLSAAWPQCNHLCHRKQ